MSEQGWIFTIGTIVAVVSYFSKNFIFDQLLIYRKIVGRIKNRLRLHAGIITNDELPSVLTKPVRQELRQLSCDLDECYFSVPFVSRLHWLYGMPSVHKLDSAASKLIFLSNNTGRKNSVEKNHEAIQLISKNLKIRESD